VKKRSFLGSDKKDQAVHKSQQLAVIVFPAKSSCAYRYTKLCVEGVAQKPLSQCNKRILYATSQVLSRSRSFLVSRVPPCLERAFCHWLACSAKPRRMTQQPQRGEVRKPAFLEHPVQICLHPRRSRQTRVLAHKPKHESVANKAPQRAILGV